MTDQIKPSLKPDMARKLHTVMVGATKVAVLLPDIYENIKTIVGVDPIAPGTPSGADTTASSADLMKSGQALKIRIRYTGGTNPAGKTSDILCDIDKAKTAIGELVGATFKTGATIKSAYFPRRARLG